MPFVDVINKLLEVLSSFTANPTARFNFNKFALQVGLSPTERELLINLIFKFQELFCECLHGYSIRAMKKNTTTYLLLAKQDGRAKAQLPYCHEITLEKAQSHLLTDIIYYFQHVQIGKGFELAHNGSKLVAKVNKLRKVHPYFFEHHGNGLVYPTQLALTVGNQLLSHSRGNKELDHLNIDNYSVKIV